MRTVGDRAPFVGLSPGVVPAAVPPVSRPSRAVSRTSDGIRPNTSREWESGSEAGARRLPCSRRYPRNILYFCRLKT